MAKGNNSAVWTVGEGELLGLDAMGARDLIIECFFHAQSETFTRTKTMLGREVNDETLRRSVEAAVRVAFENSGGDFDDPNAESVAKAVESLARSASSWGTPLAVIEHHRRQAERIIAAIR